MESKLTVTDDRPFKKFNFDFLAKQISLLNFSLGEFDLNTATRCLRICPSKLKSNPLYLETSFEQTPLRNRGFSMTSNPDSIDELAFDLEFFKTKIEHKLAPVGFTV